MKVIECNTPTYFDCDDTLVKWSSTPEEKEQFGVTFSCTLEDGSTYSELLVPHRKHIEQLKAHKLRGHTIILWTAGSWQWGKCVAETLGLSQYIDVVLEKPKFIYDDLPVNEFIPKPYYYEDV